MIGELLEGCGAPSSVPAPRRERTIPIDRTQRTVTRTNDVRSVLGPADQWGTMTDPGTRATYETVAKRYRKLNEDRSVVEELVSRFLAAVDETTDGRARVLDAGCGPGWESARFGATGHEAVGIDLARSFLEIAREEAPASSFAQMDMRRLGFPSGAFDGVWACASFLHVPREDAQATLAELRRVLRPDGPVHLSVKHGEGTREGGAYNDDHRTFVLYWPDELEDLLSSAGFTVKTVKIDDSGEWVRAEARA